MHSGFTPPVGGTHPFTRYFKYVQPALHLFRVILNDIYFLHRQAAAFRYQHFQRRQNFWILSHKCWSPENQTILS
jgi:hypothetical protein